MAAVLKASRHARSLLDERCLCGLNARNATVAIGCFHTVLDIILSSVSFVFLYKLYHTEPDDSTFWKVICYIVGVSSVLHGVESLLLIYGGLKGKIGFLLPWMVHTCMYIGFAKPAAIYCLVCLFNGDVMALAYFVALLVHAAIHIYLVAVVSVYRTYLKERGGCEQLVVSDTNSIA